MFLSLEDDSADENASLTNPRTVVTLWSPLERLDVVSQLGVSLTVAETIDPVSTRWKMRTNSRV